MERTLIGDWLVTSDMQYIHIPSATATTTLPDILSKTLVKDTMLQSDYEHKRGYMKTKHEFAIPLGEETREVTSLVHHVNVGKKWMSLNEQPILTSHTPPEKWLKKEGQEEEEDDSEFTDEHLDTEDELPPKTAEWKLPTVSHISKVGPEGTAFVINNMLSPSECDDIIQQAKGFTMVSVNREGYPKYMRVNDRVAVVSENLSHSLFQRAVPFLSEITLSSRKNYPDGIPMGTLPGVWTPDHINPCFRVCRYQPGGHFTCHLDGGFSCNNTLTSLKTFMIYLNTVEPDAGGPTTFYNEQQVAYETGDPKNAIHKYQPSVGECLVFSSELMHDGGKLVSGEKWLLRTEVMYRHSPLPETA